MPEVKRWFLTVDWCNQGKRGIFCKNDGSSFAQDEPFNEDRMWDILNAFQLILYPQSILLSATELKEYSQWHPLAEYSNVYGYVIKKGAS